MLSDAEEDIAEKPIGEGVDLKSPSCLKTISLGGHPSADTRCPTTDL